MRAEIVVSGPHATVTIRTCVWITAAVKVRIVIASGPICNVDVVPPTKGRAITVIAVCGIFIVVVYIFFEVAIPVIIFQRVYKGVGGVLISRRI